MWVTPAPGPDPRRPPARGSGDGDGWVSCACGQRHWGRYGAAGLLLADGEGQVVLQHRAPWSHHGGTWGVPGGARNADESAVQAAVREAGEEAGVRAPVFPHASHELAHPDWSYTTVLAHVPGGMQVRATDAESVQVRWYPVDQVTALPLLGAFAEAWPLLQRMLNTRSVLVVDAANVVVPGPTVGGRTGPVRPPAWRTGSRPWPVTASRPTYSACPGTPGGPRWCWSPRERPALPTT